ncbi:hypothetical protein DFS33DRAFT_1374034 [Desarmillaria ectypa]|nr:hypothetical protein DFS33DRAFT_1374034 [Desarmillaria ectypa]
MATNLSNLSAACVVAGRLAEADPSLKFLHVHSGRYFVNMAHPILFMYYLARQNKALDGRQAAVQTGKCVGEGSCVNCDTSIMMHARASASDLDDWEKVGNPGWDSKDLIPLARKISSSIFLSLETYEPITSEGLSTDGDFSPIHVSRGGHKTDIGDQFLAVAKKYDKERGFTGDVNDLSSCNAYGVSQVRSLFFDEVYPFTVARARSHAAHHFIYNQEHNTNLEVLTGQLVKRVLFENNCAVGVNDIDQAASAKKKFASHLVVLTAGTFGGIGAKHILAKSDIPLVVDLPDHRLVLTPYNASNDSDSMKAMFEGKDSELNTDEDTWIIIYADRRAYSGIDSDIKIRPTEKDLAELGPELKKRWESLYVPASEKSLLWLGPIARYMGRTPDLPDGKLFTMVYVKYTTVICRHADVLALRWAHKRGRELARRMGAYHGEHKPDHPSFSERSSAIIGDASGPIDIDAPDIVYSADDGKITDAYHRANGAFVFHILLLLLGSSAMKPRQKMGAADSRLNVYGIQNLKVADLSITSSNVNANTYNTTMIIGEKAAIIIAEELGIKGELLAVPTTRAASLCDPKV